MFLLLKMRHSSLIFLLFLLIYRTFGADVICFRRRRVNIRRCRKYIRRRREYARRRREQITLASFCRRIGIRYEFPFDRSGKRLLSDSCFLFIKIIRYKIIFRHGIKHKTISFDNKSHAINRLNRNDMKKTALLLLIALVLGWTGCSSDCRSEESPVGNERKSIGN